MQTVDFWIGIPLRKRPHVTLCLPRLVDSFAIEQNRKQSAHVVASGQLLLVGFELEKRNEKKPRKSG